MNTTLGHFVHSHPQKAEACEFLKEKVAHNWEAKGKAYHLTKLGQELSTERPDLKKAIGGIPLLVFIQENLSNEINVIDNSMRKAGQWGVVPKTSGVHQENFDPSIFLYPKAWHGDSKTKQLSERKPDEPQKYYSNEERFMHHLKHLPNEDLGRIFVPLDVLLKMYRIK